MLSKTDIERHLHGNFPAFYRRFLPGLKQATGAEMKAKCPFHEDTDPSLYINSESGKYHCFGCNAEGDVFSFYARSNNLDIKQDFQRVLAGIAEEFGIPDGNGDRHKATVVARYDYTDKARTLLYQIERLEPKSFRIRRPDGRGGWLYNRGDVRIVPYNLPDILRADEVLIVEGEKDCDNLKAIGFVATCNPFGAGKWRDDFGKYFAGKHVVLIPDNDEPGRKHMQAVAEKLRGYATSTTFLDLSKMEFVG